VALKAREPLVGCVSLGRTAGATGDAGPAPTGLPRSGLTKRCTRRAICGARLRRSYLSRPQLNFGVRSHMYSVDA
jgi:hypothetical protein